MEFIQTKNYGNPMDVVFNGGQYIFIDRWYGLVAIATRRDESIGENPAVFDVEICHTMNPSTLRRVIHKSENKFIERTEVYHVTTSKADNLPYNLKLEVVPR